MIESGVYLLIYNHHAVYVGQTLNLKKRLTGHKDKIYDRVRFLKCPIEDLWRVELDLIYRFEPMYNKSYHTEYSLGLRLLSLRKERDRLKKIVEQQG